MVISFDIFWRSIFDKFFNNSIPSHIQNTLLFFFNPEQGANLDRSRLVIFTNSTLKCSEETEVNYVCLGMNDWEIKYSLHGFDLCTGLILVKLVR